MGSPFFVFLKSTVCEAIEWIRETQYAPTFYNDEQALRYVIKFAYIAAIDQYLKVEELPSGRGIADVVYLPKRKSTLPALVVELKWNKSSVGAIRQIKALWLYVFQPLQFPDDKEHR